MFTNNNTFFRNIIATVAITLMLFSAGCAGITDAGLNQEQADKPTPQTQVDQDNELNQDPFGTGDEPGVIYDEPDL